MSTAGTSSGKRSHAKVKIGLPLSSAMKGILKRRSKQMLKLHNKRVRFAKRVKMGIISADQVTFIDYPLRESESGKGFVLQRRNEQKLKKGKFGFIKPNSLASRYIASLDRPIKVRRS